MIASWQRLLDSNIVETTTRTATTHLYKSVFFITPGIHHRTTEIQLVFVERNPNGIRVIIQTRISPISIIGRAFTSYETLATLIVDNRLRRRRWDALNNSNTVFLAIIRKILVEPCCCSFECGKGSCLKPFSYIVCIVRCLSCIRCRTIRTHS